MSKFQRLTTEQYNGLLGKGLSPVEFFGKPIVIVDDFNAGFNERFPAKDVFSPLEESYAHKRALELEEEEQETFYCENCGCDYNGYDVEDEYDDYDDNGEYDDDYADFMSAYAAHPSHGEDAQYNEDGAESEDDDNSECDNAENILNIEIEVEGNVDLNKLFSGVDAITRDLHAVLGLDGQTKKSQSRGAQKEKPEDKPRAAQRSHPSTEEEKGEKVHQEWKNFTEELFSVLDDINLASEKPSAQSQPKSQAKSQERPQAEPKSQPENPVEDMVNFFIQNSFSPTFSQRQDLEEEERQANELEFLEELRKKFATPSDASQNSKERGNGEANQRNTRPGNAKPGNASARNSRPRELNPDDILGFFFR